MKNYERVTPHDKVQMLNVNQQEDMTRFYMYALRCFDLENQIENGELLMREETINTTVVTHLQTKIQDLEKENAELKARLEKAVELKAKEGDVIYMPWIYDGSVAVSTLLIIGVNFYKDEFIYITNLESDSPYYLEKYKHGIFRDKDFNSIVFTNRTEAEKRLAELQGEEE